MLDYLISFVGRLGHWGVPRHLSGLGAGMPAVVELGHAGQELLDPGVLSFATSIAAIAPIFPHPIWECELPIVRSGRVTIRSERGSDSSFHL